MAPVFSDVEAFPLQPQESHRHFISLKEKRKVIPGQHEASRGVNYGILRVSTYSASQRQ